MRDGANLIEHIGQEVRAFDALVCVSDPVAFGALNACRRLGIDVPGDIAITGFGEFDVAIVSEPRITTVDVSARQIGVEVAGVLAGIFNGDDPAIAIDVGVRLVPGGTT